MTLLYGFVTGSVKVRQVQKVRYRIGFVFFFWATLIGRICVPPSPPLRSEVHKTNLFNTFFFLGAKWGNKRQLPMSDRESGTRGEERRGEEICNNKYVTRDWVFFFGKWYPALFCIVFFFFLCCNLFRPVSLSRGSAMVFHYKVWYGKVRFSFPYPTRYALHFLVQASISFQKRTRRKGKMEKKP